VDSVLREMFDCLNRGTEVFRPSKYWEELTRKNIDQLEAGTDNIKRTVAQDYFTWVIRWYHEQFRFLAARTLPWQWPRILRNVRWSGETAALPRGLWIQLQIFTLMLWEYAARHDPRGTLARLREPAQGNPFPIVRGEELISQDLANASLELASISDVFHPEENAEFRVCELGAGYGRNAFVFLSMFPRCRYVIVDIPPSLFVAQEYLTRVFSDRRIFRFRCFDRIEEVEDELMSADIAFLLPHQAAQLRPKSVDLFLNISSLHEMTIAQITAYFGIIERLTCGFFYSKQWQVSHNPHDGIVVKRDAYPIPPHWRVCFDRRARVQTSFFEAMYEVGRGD
jgi:putative sugar O-methyltransferase